MIDIRSWQIVAPDPERVADIRQRFQLSTLPALTLAARDFSSLEAIEDFLRADLSDLADPMELPGMEGAVARIRRAVAEGSRVRVFGDYDVDGLSATALLITVLRRMGATVDYRLPSRFREGYGLSNDVIDACVADGVGVLLTADNGITALEEAAYARAQQVDLIVTDHHEPDDILPEAYSLINPKHPQSHYPDRHLAGVGVAYQLARALDSKTATQQLDLVALGTVADMVPLTGENRTLVREGLNQLNRIPREGIRALMRELQLEAGTLNEGHIAFALGPALNAPGRLGESHWVVELLTTNDPARAAHWAAACCAANEERKKLQQAVVEAVESRASRDSRFARRRCWVAGGEAWHPGVLGPAASTLAGRHGRPVVLLAPDPGTPGEWKGSGRSIGTFNLLEALRSVGGEWLGCGGHRAAAGVALAGENMAQFEDGMDQWAATHLRPTDVIRSLPMVEGVPLGAIDATAVRELDELGPFGHGYPRPVFLARGVTAREARPFGRDDAHLRLGLRDCSMQVVGFFWGDRWKAQEKQQIDAWDLAFSPEINGWQNRERVELHLKDLRPAGAGLRASGLSALRLRWRRLSQQFPEEERLRALWAELRQWLPRDGMQSMADLQKVWTLEPPWTDEALRGGLDLLAQMGYVAPMQRGEDLLWLRLSDEDALELETWEHYRWGREQLRRIQTTAEQGDRASAQAWIESLYGFSLDPLTTDGEGGSFNDL